MDNRFHEFENIGSKVLCESDIPNQIPVPQWLDKEKIRRAKNLVKRHFFGIFFAHLSGLILLVHIKSILIPLLLTGNSRTVTHLFNRYLRTLMHIKGWYEGDVWDINHSSHHSIMQVRKMHSMVSKKLNNGKKEGIDEICISQCDMVMTQFAFVGFIALFPKQMGCSQSDEDIDAILHFWRGIGHLLGIEDKYNLCVGSVEDIKSMCELILEKRLKKSITESTYKESHEMSRGIINAIKIFVRLLTYDGLIHYLYEVIDLQRDVKLSLMSRISYHSIRITFNYLCRITLLSLIMNYLLRLSLFITNTNWRKKSIENTLNKKYDLVLAQTPLKIESNLDIISV